MSQISDDAIRKDIYSTLKMWERFNTLEEEQRNKLVEYLFNAYGHLYREENIRIEKIQ
ncbi:MAG: hypothetical protein NTZ51_03215 [Proteobacteria bacterium]|nr:hypothetical protein [Pseudomonadota bacterium]